MKRLVLPGVVSLLLSAVALAAPLNLTVTSLKKRFDVERSQGASSKQSSEKWGYTITIENKSFKNLENLQVEYRQYKMDEVIRGEAKLKAIPGKTTIPTLPNAKKFTFDTDPISIEKKELRPGWSYRGGGKEKQQDSVMGYWLKIMQGNEVVFETQYPADAKSKMTW
jgi:hypothetical protein